MHENELRKYEDSLEHNAFSLGNNSALYNENETKS